MHSGRNESEWNCPQALNSDDIPSYNWFPSSLYTCIYFPSKLTPQESNTFSLSAPELSIQLMVRAWTNAKTSLGRMIGRKSIAPRVQSMCQWHPFIWLTAKQCAMFIFFSYCSDIIKSHPFPCHVHCHYVCHVHSADRARYSYMNEGNTTYHLQRNSCKNAKSINCSSQQKFGWNTV